MAKTRKRGGRASMLAYLQNLNDQSNVLGAGGYGIVLQTRSHAIKLFYEPEACQSLNLEARIQQRATQLLQGIIHVPTISEYTTQPFVWSNNIYLCGIAMKAIKPPPEFGGHQLHMLLGYSGSDIDTVWLKHSGKPAGPDNPPRGFFASPETLEDHWEDVGSQWTIERVSYTMGRAIGALVKGGVVPNDLEFIYGGDNNLWLVDFGLCRFGNVDPVEFLKRRNSEGLASDIYIPQAGYRGRSEFIAGYIESFTTNPTSSAYHTLIANASQIK